MPQAILSENSTNSENKSSPSSPSFARCEIKIPGEPLDKVGCCFDRENYVKLTSERAAYLECIKTVIDRTEEAQQNAERFRSPLFSPWTTLFLGVILGGGTVFLLK